MKIDITTLQDLDAIASKIANIIQTGQHTISLEGELGAGKTTFTQHLLKHLGVNTHIPSPTYNIINEYETDRHRIIHADFYRLDSKESLDLIGWDLATQKADIIIAEWPKDFIDANINIDITILDKRIMTINSSNVIISKLK